MRCVLTYVGLYVAAWVAAAFTAPERERYGELVRIALGMMVFIGIPSVLLAVGAGMAHTRMDPVRFRCLLAFPLALFALPAAYASPVAQALVFQVFAHCAFASLMPVPLAPGRWRGARTG
ncbi:MULTISPECIES: hypothetical protein [unclassified Streptomyces]|uniref:hypothetical protein n=1 Tax=unclassified Streptomyces TaxID=2593676 RepID=UPI002255CEF3|nr:MULTISPECIES: hypothetical protein [unclassified Streptomyces]MCX4527212.1 hypothetical protein [Streptomyces sp. NBC_01551]MCX4542212.1 hypothetical protein [Streptomyces sp. NBC_01565]